MALTKGDFSIAANGNIREVAGTSTHEVIELHRWLMDLLDDSESTDDDLLAVDNAIIPSTRSTDNIITLNAPYNIDQTVSERFYNGSITQNDGDDVYSGLEVVGSVNSTTTLLLVQDTDDDGDIELITNFWGDTDSALYADSANNVLLRCLIKSKSAGTTLDGGRLRIQARELGDTYSEFQVVLGQGITTGAISTTADTFNQTAAGTISGWTIGTVFGYDGVDINNDDTDEFYYFNGDFNTGGRSSADAYEYGKWQQRRGSAETMAGLNGQLYRGITHRVDLNTGGANSGTFSATEPVSWTGGTGQMLAIDSTTASAANSLWIQLLTGSAPGNGVLITAPGSGATATTAAASATTAQTVNANCYMGNYVGSWLGAYGVAFEPISNNGPADSFTALDGTARNPAANVDLVATGLVSGDIIFAAKTKTDTDTVSGAHSIGDTTLTLTTGIDTSYDTVGRIVIDGEEHVYTAYTGTSVTIGGSGLKSALTGGETTSVTQFWNDEFTTTATSSSFNATGDSNVEFSTSIGKGFPTTGKVRLWDGVDRYDEYSYTGISGARLTGITPVLSQDYGSVAAFIPYVSETATGSSITKGVVHTTDVDGRWRLYNASANIVPFEVGFTITSGGSTTQLIRNSDA